MILLWESSWLVASNEERNSMMGKSKESLYAATPVVPGISVPLRDIGYMSIGTLLSVGAHEFGHALAAASMLVNTGITSYTFILHVQSW